jgi:hypothetical protein
MACRLHRTEAQPQDVLTADSGLAREVRWSDLVLLQETLKTANPKWATRSHGYEASDATAIEGSQVAGGDQIREARARASRVE